MSVGSSTTWTPGRVERSATSGADARRSSRPWALIRRVILTVAIAVGAWALLAAWPGSAQANPVELPPCVDLPPAPCTAPALDPAVAPPPDPGVPAPLVPLDVPVAVDPVVADPVLADPVLADPVLADPVLADPVLADPVLADPVLIPDEDPAPSVDAVPPPEPDGAGTIDEPQPAPDDPAPAEPADSDPADAAPLDPALVDPEGLDGADLGTVDPTIPPLVDPALVDPALVDPALAVVTTVPVDPMAATGTLLDVAPVLCSDPGYVPVAATDTAARGSGSTVDPPARVREEPAGTGPIPATVPSGGSATPVDVEDQGDPPAAPTAPPSPARLPAPLPAPTPAGPAGCPMSTSSGACCYGPGQTEHADGVDAVLEARVTASLAQAAVRATSGFAGAVVGGADDPGVRPG